MPARGERGAGSVVVGTVIEHDAWIARGGDPPHDVADGALLVEGGNDDQDSTLCSTARALVMVGYSGRQRAPGAAPRGVP